MDKPEVSYQCTALDQEGEACKIMVFTFQEYPISKIENFIHELKDDLCAGRVATILIERIEHGPET